MYAPLAIANTIVARHPGRATMGLCKLVYLVQGWGLAFDMNIVGTLPEVWKYGPVHRDVYTAFRGFGSNPIHTPQPAPGGITPPMVPERDQATISIIDQVVARYADFDDLGLSDIAHAPGSPWKIIADRHELRIPVGTTVDEALITAHFKRILEGGSERQREAA